MKADLIIIGDEILNGNTLDTNSQFIAERLEALNIKVRQRTTISDDRETILETLKNASEKSDLIITTGGLGPTKDDITKKTLADFLGEELRMDEKVLAQVEEFFERRNRKILDVNRLQALVPESCEVMPNELGTAPGMWVEKNGKIYVSMPGVPYEMKNLVENHLIPKLGELKETDHIVHKFIHTVGAGESGIAKQIAEIEDALPTYIKLAYLPSPGIVKLRLSGTGLDRTKLEKEMDGFVEQIKKILQGIIFGYGKDTLSSAIGHLLKVRSESVGTAESCTSGYLAQLITQTPGSSHYYGGSFIAYSYSLKEQMLGVNHATLQEHGAVSQATIEEMARGGQKRLDVDYCIATSGIAGPGGGMPNKPVGTVWIAVATRKEVISKKFQFGFDRERNTHLSAIMGLNMLRSVIQGLPISDSLKNFV